MHTYTSMLIDCALLSPAESSTVTFEYEVITLAQ